MQPASCCSTADATGAEHYALHGTILVTYCRLVYGLQAAPGRGGGDTCHHRSKISAQVAGMHGMADTYT
jgi:hypothetical protein